ncbi:MAG: RluA family pseudouridine synthase [Anaplasmataceae bacterium]|nr:RluA family pseudouridine synthase [Anaplasmataceae bacterium]
MKYENIKYHKFIVVDDNVRIDRYIKYIINISQSLLEKMFRKKDILVNKDRISSSDKVNNGDVIYIKRFILKFNINGNSNVFIPVNLKEKINILYENEYFLVLDKEYGMPVQGGNKIKYSIDRIFNSNSENKFYLVHRLDKNTTGILLIAKTQIYARFLIEKFYNRSIHKAYYAVVHNKPKKKSFFIKKNISKKVFNGIEKMAVDINGLEAITEVHLISTNNEVSFLKIIIHTGRKHQIRVHLADEGLPILGDSKYGINDNEKRMFLHAYQVNFDEYKFTSNLPNWFVELSTKLNLNFHEAL